MLYERWWAPFVGFAREAKVAHPVCVPDGLHVAPFGGSCCAIMFYCRLLACVVFLVLAPGKMKVLMDVVVGVVFSSLTV